MAKAAGPTADSILMVDALPGHRLEAGERAALTIEDHALYIYTSGTTGLPKAANINHYRVMLATHAFAGVMDTKPTDRMYDCLPMYHTVGGLVATGAVLLNGGSVVIREKFSAREFWDDVVRYECTLFQYIGELCRYLVHSPPNPNETRHRLRMACGNGLRPDLWEEFKTRFRIPHILEFYGATEGNVNIFNFEGKQGAVGRVPWFVAHRFPIAVVRFDVEQQQPVRNAEGFCERCDANEPGEVIGRIVNDPERPGNRFEGYAAANQNENKILHNVFEKGDAWFRTGDLMRKDAQRLFLFRRSRRRHLPLEGRERLDLGGGGGDQHLPRHPGRQRLWRHRGRPRRPRRDGGDRLRRTVRSRRAACASGAPTCRTTRGRCSCASRPRST